MNKLFTTIKTYVNRVLGLFPTSLPMGMQAFQDWTQSIIDTWEIPTSDRPSIEFALATMIMHFGPTEARKPKYYFVLSLRAAAAKQVAHDTFQNVKNAQIEASKAAQQNEATTLKVVASSDIQK